MPPESDPAKRPSPTDPAIDLRGKIPLIVFLFVCSPDPCVPAASLRVELQRGAAVPRARRLRVAPFRGRFAGYRADPAEVCRLRGRDHMCRLLDQVRSPTH